MHLLIKAIKHPSLALKVIFYRLLSTIGSRNFKRFIVLSRSRTGSNLLISFLNSHPNIHTEGEIFARLNGRKYSDVLAEGFAKQSFFVKAKGFKIFYYHPLDDESHDIWNALTNLDDLHIIHLKRRNIFQTLISRKIAGIQDVWSTSSPERFNADKNKAVTFTVKELCEGFKETREWEQAGEEKFNNHPLISIYYEDLVSNCEATFGKITEFLAVRYSQPKTDLKKQNPQRLRDLVTNYDELKSAFAGTEWQDFFEDA